MEHTIDDVCGGRPSHFIGNGHIKQGYDLYVRIMDIMVNESRHFYVRDYVWKRLSIGLKVLSSLPCVCTCESNRIGQKKTNAHFFLFFCSLARDVRSMACRRKKNDPETYSSNTHFQFSNKKTTKTKLSVSVCDNDSARFNSIAVFHSIGMR